MVNNAKVQTTKFELNKFSKQKIHFATQRAKLKVESSTIQPHHRAKSFGYILTGTTHFASTVWVDEAT